MAIFCSEEISPVDVKGRIIQRLVQGKAMANQLQILLRDLGRDGSDGSVHGLAAKILGSFTMSLSELSSQHPQPKQARVGTEFGNKERSVESRVIRRGCYKRRKSSQTRTMVASTTVDDHTWRKYGQKEILNSKFPRSYFRCTHKYDRNCKAVKQVQKMEENPPTYEITYIDAHTCMDGCKAPPPQLWEDTAALRDIQSFDALSHSNAADMKEDILFSFSSSTMTALDVKEEAKEDAKSDTTNIEITSLLMEAGDLAEDSSVYKGFGMNFLLENDGSEISMFDF